MGRRVQVAEDYARVVLPDGNMHSAGDVVVLSDVEWARVNPNLLANVLVDLGATSHSGDPASGGGKELDYAETTQSFENSTRTLQDVPGLSVTFEADGVTPVMLQAYCYALGQANAGFWTGVVIREGATTLAASIIVAPVAGWITPPVTLKSDRFIPTAGFHTYTVAISKQQSGAGMATLYAAGTGGAKSWLKAHTVDVAD